MKTITVFITIALIATSSFAGDRGHYNRHSYNNHHHHHNHYSRGWDAFAGFAIGSAITGAVIYSQPRTVYVQPAPVYVQPAPVYIERQTVYPYNGSCPYVDGVRTYPTYSFDYYGNQYVTGCGF